MSSSTLPPVSEKLHRIAPCFIGIRDRDFIIADMTASEPPAKARLFGSDFLFTPTFLSSAPFDFAPITEPAVHIRLCRHRGFIAPADARTFVAIDGAAHDLPVGDILANRNVFIGRKATVPLSEAVHSVPTPVVDDAWFEMVYDFPLTKENGYLLGAMAGNGYVGPNGMFLVDVCPEVSDALDECIAKLFFGVNGRPLQHVVVQKGSLGAVSIRNGWMSQPLAQFVAAQIGVGAEFKHLPGVFWAAPREFLVGLFAGLMDTDGTIAVIRGRLAAAYSTTSLRLAREILVLCGMLGVQASISASDHPTQPWHTLREYKVVLAPASFSRFAPHLPLRKPDRLRPLAAGAQVGKSEDPVPVSAAVVNVVSECDCSKRDRTDLFDAYKRGSVQRVTAIRWLDLLGRENRTNDAETRRWSALVGDTSLRWDRVTAVETSTRLSWWPAGAGTEYLTTANGYLLSPKPKPATA